MRTINVNTITENIKDMCIQANHFLADDMDKAMKHALETEEAPLGRQILDQLQDNLKIAAEDMIPICQDTGMAVIFMKIGQDVHFEGGSLEDAINANTKALEKTNSALADMIRQAGALVLSDNMRLGSTVAASGTAQVVSAARSYHREGDTTINQYIQSKAQTAADLARETRWEADKAKARKR